MAHGSAASNPPAPRGNGRAYAAEPMKTLHSLCVAAVLASLVAAQTDEEYERELAASARMRETALANLKRGEPVIALEWRRSAAGDLEFKPPQDAAAKFAPWFAKGIADAVATAGTIGMVMLPAHHGDVLSLTLGEHHLRRLGIARTTPELVTFIRSPLPELLRDVALLDRMVAIDLLHRRGDDGAKAACAAIVADAALAGPLRERAGGAKPARRSLDAATVPLPAHCDLVVVCNHAQLFDAQPLVEIGHIVGLVSTMRVVQMLKMPLVSDFTIGQTESEFVTGLPFEIARRFGNFRLDQTMLVWCPAKAGAVRGLFVASAGSFSPAAIVAGVPSLGIDGATAELANGAAKAKFAGTDVVVTDSIATATPGVAVAPRPDLAARLLARGDVGLCCHVPSGSALLGELKALGIQGVESIDATASCGDPVVVDATLRTKDAASAAAAAKQVKDQVLRIGLLGYVVRAALELDDTETRTVAVDGNEVRVHFELARSKLLTPELVRERLIGQLLR